jgi:two-component system sensor histidine kinase BaeS
MERMVDRVLAFRQLAQVDKSLRLEAHEPSVLVRQALAPWTEVADPAASRLELVLEPGLPRLLADPDTLNEAVRNLVGNAIKHSSGAVVVTLRHDGEGIAISVRDQGPAISRSEQKRIFKRFYRISDDGDGAQGSGLGLAIALRAAEALGGSLELRSTRGIGNVFILRLPLVEVPAPRPPSAAGIEKPEPPTEPAPGQERG